MPAKSKPPRHIILKANAITRKYLEAITQQRAEETGEEATMSGVIRSLIREEFKRKNLSIFSE